MLILKTPQEASAFIDEHEKVLLLCKTHDCNVCLSVEARFKHDSELYTDWSIANVYVDDLSLFRGEHTVFTVPTVLMFFQQKEIYRTSRFIDYNKLAYFVDALKP